MTAKWQTKQVRSTNKNNGKDLKKRGNMLKAGTHMSQHYREYFDMKYFYMYRHFSYTFYHNLA